MGRPSLILAALAADAAPGKKFRGIRKLDESQTQDNLLLQDETGANFIFKMPSSPQGETELAQERAVLRALAMVSHTLPFEISTELGSTRDAAGEVGVLFSALEGAEPDLAKLPAGAFSKTFADALAAIHSLDTSLVRSAGLPEYDSTSQLHQRVAELDRIASLGRVPAALLTRWESALEDVGLFRYHSTVIHGGISKETLKLDGQRLVGLGGFENLRISDPAEDLSWIVGAGLSATVEDTLLHYRAARPAADENLMQRATLYSELELGSWLAHCVEQGDEVSIAQAEDLISELRDQLEAGSLRDLRAASFAGIVAGSAMLPEITNAIPVIDEPAAQQTSAQVSAEYEPEVAEIEVETVVTESIEISGLFEQAEQKDRSNPDELF